MDAIGKNTARGCDLRQRAELIAGKERSLDEMSGQVKELKAEIKDLYKDAASNGYSLKVLRGVMKEFHMPEGEREAHYQIEMEFAEEVDIYRHALGLVKDGSAETTISINGGPAAPISVVRAAVDEVKRAKVPA